MKKKPRNNKYVGRCTMSTLSRATEIEQEFYRLKAQEWACGIREAEEKITEALIPVRAEFFLRRHPMSNNDLLKLVRENG
jgi:hypothetical protein